jgi:hypothetical protein
LKPSPVIGRSEHRHKCERRQSADLLGFRAEYSVRCRARFAPLCAARHADSVHVHTGPQRHNVAPSLRTAERSSCACSRSCCGDCAQTCLMLPVVARAHWPRSGFSRFGEFRQEPDARLREARGLPHRSAR